MDEYEKKQKEKNTHQDSDRDGVENLQGYLDAYNGASSLCPKLIKSCPFPIPIPSHFYVVHSRPSNPVNACNGSG